MASTVDTELEYQVPDMPSFTKGYHHRSYDSISPSRPEIAAAAAGKNIVVTGGGTGIGKATAIAFAQAGVAILGRRPDRLQQAAAEIKSAAKSYGHSPIIVTETVDLLQRNQVDAALQSIHAKVGGGSGAAGPTYLDVLISNAGSAPKWGTVLGYDADVMMDSLGLNLLSAFNAVQAWAPLAPPPPQAVLINVSSMVAHAAPMVENFAYAVSKAANLKMMDFFAFENPGIHLVNLQPGIINTELGGDDKPSYKAPDERQ
jgi:NAD(P)-dependent dehydrogenase (short-subunit alcohol dehydrogenase family)